MKELWLYLKSLRRIMNIFEVMMLNMAPISLCQSQKQYYLGNSEMGKRPFTQSRVSHATIFK